MVERDEKVFERIKKLVQKKPDADVAEAIEAAREIDESIDPDDKRSFNARYVLPAKRTTGVTARKKKKEKRKRAAQKAAETRKRRRQARKRARQRERIRNLVLERDQQVLDAMVRDDDATRAYELAAGLDDYLEKIVAAVRG